MISPNNPELPFELGLYPPYHCLFFSYNFKMQTAHYSKLFVDCIHAKHDHYLALCYISGQPILRTELLCSQISIGTRCNL